MAKELKTILYVEDDTDIQAVTQLALETIGGYEITLCSSGNEAVEKAHGFVPDCILLDVMMPEMDGPTTLVELKKLPSYQGIPVIFMTAKVMDKEVKEYIELGASGVISKPFDPMTLANQIKEIWQRAVDG